MPAQSDQNTVTDQNTLARQTRFGLDAARALSSGRHFDPFSALGPHRDTDSGWCVRALGIGATSVELLLADEQSIEMTRIADTEVFEVARLRAEPQSYRLKFVGPSSEWLAQDPYRFSSLLGELDLHLIGEGNHRFLYEHFGAHLVTHSGVEGVQFCLWAPNAKRVSVVGPFNNWDGRVHVLRHHPSVGIWDLFVPELGEGELYKFELLDANGRLLPLKADPFARRMEPPPGNASIVESTGYDWDDKQWMGERPRQCAHDEPMSIYELHAASWKRHIPNGEPYSYDELADDLIPYLSDMGFTHIELLPITEHPFEGSWGYQPIGLFAPTWRHGEPAGFKRFIDRCHRAGIGVIVDWVPAHFPRDTYGLGLFDGSHLYEHADPRQGAHRDWGTLIFNYGRREVANYLIASALFWVREFHIDALRVDAVASMLYLDYSREADDWVPNEYGGNQNFEAVEFLKHLNSAVHAEGAVTIAEESTAWPQVSRPLEQGGLGFSYKWNMGWMHDVLQFMQEDPIHRQYHFDKLTFGLLYAFSESFVLPLSHDEVVHGKRSLLDRMPGDAWERFANLRLLYGFMFAYPGKKLLFMGSEFGQGSEWDHAGELDWWLLERNWHRGMSALVKALNACYRGSPALFRADHEPQGFEWIDCEDRANSVLSFVRRAEGEADVVAVLNFTPVVRHGYRIGVALEGEYEVCMNTDLPEFCGRGIGSSGRIASEAIAWHGRAHSLCLSLPPLGALWLRRLAT